MIPKLTEKQVWKSVAIYLIGLGSVALMLWLVSVENTDLIWAAWFVIYFILLFTPVGDRYFKKIVGVKDWYRGAAMIHVFLASAAVGIGWALVYQFHCFF